MYYNIGIVKKSISNKYLYKSNINLFIGQLVIVNFCTKDVMGIVLEIIENTNYNGSIKEIKDVLHYIIHQGYIKFIELFAKHNLVALGTALQLIIPFSIENINKVPKRLKSIKPSINKEVILNEEQKKAVNSIWSNINKFNTTLLHGITGSGKTEVFLDIIKRLLINKAQILILVPEIALSNALAQSIANRCNIEVFIWHNSINITTKLYIWRKALNNEPILVVGARSALFIPFSNLKFIVVDEEHELTFKQINSPIYQARDMAVYLAYCLNIPIVLSSATPSIESYRNAIDKKYNYVKLTSRFNKNAKLPSIIINNMIGTPCKEIFSIETLNEINNYLKLKQQVLIFCNRRGYAPKRFCPKCGWKALCPACDTLLCYHIIDKVLRCHRCGYECTNINKCPKCYNPYLINMGVGIEKVYSECNRLFPNAKIIMCSSENMNTPNKIENIINKITNNEVDIIIGTQILAKGHNFNSLNLVVIVNIDYMLYSEDFRALEHTFQLLNQVSGRAGRMGNIESKVIIQSYNPEALEIYKNSNNEIFYNRELQNRKLTNMPPYGYIASIEISSKSQEKAMQFSEYIKDQLISIKKLFINENNNKEELQSNQNIKLENNKVLLDLENSNNKLFHTKDTVLKSNSSAQNIYINKFKDIKIIGPIKPVLYKINYKYRYKILIISKYPITNYINDVMSCIKKPSNISISVDLNPYDFV